MKHTADEMDSKAKTLAKEWLRTEGELLSHLMAMRNERVFAELNFSGIFDYCERALHLSRAQSYYFKTVAEKSESVPALREAVVQGEITLSQARRIASVIAPDNHQLWIAEAKQLSQAELEKRVASVNPKAHVKEKIRPVAKELSELKVGLDEQTEKDLEALKDILSQKLGRAASLKEVVAWAAKVTRERFDPEKKAERRLGKKLVSSGNRMPPKPGRHPIPAAIRHAVTFSRGWRCWHFDPSGRRCEQRRWLHFHHLRPVALGGMNTVDNLELRCSAHHALAHRS